jgi:hypothetical protein
MRSGGGRFRQYQRVTRQRPPRAPAAVFAPPACLEESFAGASWPIGSDLTWDEGHQASMSNGGGGTTDDGSTSTKRTIHVVSDKLAIKAPDDSLLTGGHQWYRTKGHARTTTDVASADMTVTATVTGASALVNAEYLLIVRNAVDASEDIGNANLAAYIVYFSDNYIEVDLGYHSSSTLTLEGGGIFVKDSSAIGFTHTFAPGDTISVTATGTASSTVVSCKVNGVEYVHIDDTDLSAAMSGYLGDPLSDLPVGQRAGVGLFVSSLGSPFDDLTVWDHGAWDDVISLDDFEACPA